MNINSIAVFCGSRSGEHPLFVGHATAVGKAMAERNITLIYGGGRVGIMGAVANGVMENGGSVTGVLPELLLEWEQAHHTITQLHIVADMHVRKKMMYELCDAALILPGGYGTLDELFEMLTWNTLKIHEKKIILLNTAGFYDHLLAHIQHMQQQQFLYEDWRERIIVCDTPEAIFAFLDANRN